MHAVNGDHDGPTTLVYVAGDGRSGSTLLEGLLAARTGAVAVGEIRMFLSAGFRWGARCGCGDLFTECPFWTEVLHGVIPDSTEAQREAFERAGRSLIGNRHTRRLRAGADSWSEAERSLGAIHEDLYRSIAAVSEAPLIVDSSKTAAYGLFLAALPALDVRVVHLVRDSRAVAHSWRRKKEWKAAGGEDQKWMRQLSTAQASRQWMAQNAFSEVLKRRVSRSVTIRYEDLARRPAEVVNSVLEGLDLAGSTLPAQTQHGFLGNPIRFDETPAEVVLDDAWAREMRHRDRRVVTAFTFPLLLRHGYPLRTSSDNFT